MSNNIAAAGYIVHDNNGTVHGYGPTADAAWADMLGTMAQAQIELLPDDADSTNCLGSWTRESGMKLAPASQSLLDLIESVGGHVTLDFVGGVACAQSEEADVD
jgi:hypothetical protein